MLKTNNLLIIFFLLLLITVNSYGQNFFGKVLDRNSKKPLEKVSVYLTENKIIGTATNKVGEFSLHYRFSFKKKDSITFSIIGYKTHKVSIASLKEKINTIFLTRSTKTLEEISIITKKKQSRLSYKKVGSLKSGNSSFTSKLLDDKLYISGGDKTLIEDSFKKAVDRAGEGVMFLTEEAISKEWSPSLNYKSYSDALFIFSLDSNTLKKTTIKLDNRAYHQMNFHKDNLYILGGKKLTNSSSKEYLLNTIEVLNINTKKLQIDKVNPHKAVNFSSFVYKDHIIVMGGSIKIRKNGKKVFTDKIHLFNLKNGIWHEIGKMPNPRETSGVLIEDKVYFIGGFNNKPSSYIESWDLTNTKWKLEGKLFSGIERPALTYHDNNIYIFENGKLLIYNTQKSSLKEYVINLHLKRANIHFYKNSLFIIGGFREKEYSTEPSSGIYKVDISEFSKTKINRFKKLIQN